MKAPAECSTELIYSGIYITYCVCIYKRGNELSWDSPLGGWSRVKVRVSQHRARVRGATPKLDSSSREGHCFAWFLAARRCPRKSWIHCGPWEMQAEPLGLSTVGHLPDPVSLPQALPLPWVEKGEGPAPELAEPVFSEGAGVPQPASIRYRGDAPGGICSPTALVPLPAPAGAEPGGETGRGGWGCTGPLVSPSPTPCCGDGHWTVWAGPRLVCVSSFLQVRLERQTCPHSAHGDVSWLLLIDVQCEGRPAWGTCSVWDVQREGVQREGRAAWGTCSVWDVQREGRAACGTSSVGSVQRGRRQRSSEVESAWRRLGSEGLEAKSDVKAKHLSLHWWILFLNFAESVECLSKH